jgi:hypothetical protein
MTKLKSLLAVLRTRSKTDYALSVSTEQFPPPSKLLWYKFPIRGSKLEDLTGKLKGQSGMSTGPPAS